jgi:hypothetical protein
MIRDLMRVSGRVVEPFKRRAYGRTFACPVCHLELAFADTNGDGLVVCPVCGAVISLDAPYGHAVPVVVDMEIQRAQPKWRMHPLASHLPVGLYPVAWLGAALLLLVSILPATAGLSFPGVAGPGGGALLLERATLVLLVLAVGLSPLTIGVGLWDWFRRYGRRPYRIITLKIVFSVAFVLLGAVTVALQAGGAVFSPVTGMIDVSSPLHALAVAVYFAVLSLNLIVVATLGHVGGNLVFGK